MAVGDIFTIGDYQYEVVSEGYLNNVKVQAIDKTKNTYSSIPSTVTNVNTGIAYNVTDFTETFKDCTSMISAPDLDNITGILVSLRNTFQNCTSLTQAPKLPIETLSMVGTFMGCTSLISLSEFPNDTLASIQNCFKGCTSLTQVPDLPAGIGSGTKSWNPLWYAFQDCASLTEAPAIPEGVEELFGTFQGCTSLTEVPSIPNSVTDMTDCFKGCTSLTQAPVLPSSVTSITGCFEGCPITMPPEIPNNVTYISATFRNCTSLTQAPAIPSSVQHMTYTFKGCASLVQAPVIPSGVKSLKECFKDCTSLTQIPAFPSSMTEINDAGMTSCFENCTSLTQAPNIPSGITNMMNCFKGCTSLIRTPVIPSTVTTMQSAFEGCTALTTVSEIQLGVTILDSCFKDCTALRGNIIVNANVSYINSTQYPRNIFTNTTNEIFLIGGSSLNPMNKNLWANCANQYTNVHYEYNDVATPTGVLSAYRVLSDDDDETPYAKGNYIFLKAITQTPLNNAPAGTITSLSTEVYDNDILRTLSWDSVYSDGQYTNKAWYEPGDFNQHNIVISQNVDYSCPELQHIIKKVSIPSQVIPKLYALINAYHDPDTGNEGIAFGTFALTNEPQFLVDLKEVHKQQAEFESFVFINDDLFIGLEHKDLSGHIDNKLYNTILSIGFDSCIVGDQITIELNKSSIVLNLDEGDTQDQLIATYTPPSATVIWSSSNPSIAAVSDTGLVTGLVKSEEIVIITATITTGTVSASATCEVEVTGLIHVTG